MLLMQSVLLGICAMLVSLFPQTRLIVCCRKMVKLLLCSPFVRSLVTLYL